MEFQEIKRKYSESHEEIVNEILAYNFESVRPVCPNLDSRPLETLVSSPRMDSNFPAR